MRVSVIGEDKVISFGPYVRGPYKYETTVYEQGPRRLTVDSVYVNGVLKNQTKMYTVNGEKIKEIIVNFTKGIRSGVLETFSKQ